MYEPKGEQLRQTMRNGGISGSQRGVTKDEVFGDVMPCSVERFYEIKHRKETESSIISCRTNL